MPKPENKRILLVDDEADLAETMILRLRAETGAEVETAEDGETALSKIFNDRPDALVLDIALPGIDGWEVCARLRSDPRSKDLPIIVMTAWIPQEAHRKARDLGVARCFIKPFEEADFMEAVKSVLSAPLAASTPKQTRWPV